MYDVLPTPVNSMILLACSLRLKERYTWRHNEVLRVFKKYLDEKIADVNKGKLPTTEVRNKIDFYKERQKGDVTASNLILLK